jgi:CheY-like chemotaxis protein
MSGKVTNLWGQSTEVTFSEGPVMILDDNGYDAEIAQRAIEDLNPVYPVQIVCSGDDLIAYLRGDAIYSDRKTYPLPGVILLDLHMPQMDGFAVLSWLLENPRYSKAPVVVLSGTQSIASHVAKSLQHGAKFFLTKPVDIEDFKAVVSALNVRI